MPRSIAFRAFLTVLLSLFARSALADPPDDCRSPRAAVESVFGWLAPENSNPSKAARCLDPVGRTPRELRESALRIKAVYEARALRVDPESISDEPGWVNPDTGRPALVVHRALPEITVVRQADGIWRWSRASLDSVDRLYESSPFSVEGAFVKRLPNWLRARAFGVELWQALAIALIVFLAGILRQLIRVVVRGRLAELAKRRGKKLAADLVQVFATPGATLLGALMLRLVYPSLGLSLEAAVAVSSSVHVIVVAALGLALYRSTDVFATHLATRAARTDSRLDDQFVPLIRRTLKVVIVGVGALLLLHNLDVNVASLLAGLGLGGLAVALAAKDTLANFFGSVMLFVDQPFHIGDWVKIEDVEGSIEEVGFRSTRIRTLADSVVTLPNARCTEAKIDNFGARRYRRVQATLSLTYDTSFEKLQAFVEGTRAVIAAHDKTLKDNHEVHFAAFGASSLDVMLHCYVETSSWTEELRARHHLFIEILRLADALGVRFAFPTRTLHVESLAPQAAPDLGAKHASAELAEIVRAFGPGGSAAKPEHAVSSDYAG